MKQEVHNMPVIYLDEHRRLTEEQKKMAEVLLSNEINDVMADLEIMEEQLDKTAVFGELSLREIALKYLKQKVKQNPDGSVDEKVLQHVYKWYFPQQGE
jgi:phage gp29-like protein